MRIAFTHNLALSHAEEEAEFDRPETVAAITESLRRVGHEVEPVEVSGPASRVVARLEAINPELVFNTAEGARGRFREAFYPALFERLGMPFTGSDAYVCAVTLDKQLTKLSLQARGVRTPRWVFVEQHQDVEGHALRFPLMVKPNFEGSSMGITMRSIVENEDELRQRVAELLPRFAAGLLVEEFIVGRDLVVPWLEKASPATGGALEPAVYDYSPVLTAGRKYQIYDFELKVMGFDGVTVRVPADINAQQAEEAREATRRTVRVLGIRDLCRIDFRLADDGTLYFLEVNALPSLEQGSSLYLSGALAGLQGVDEVMDCVVRSAAERQGVPLRKSTKGRRRHVQRIGLAYNLAAQHDQDEPVDADQTVTVEAIHRAIESSGHDVVDLEATPELPAILPASGIDVVFNVARGIRGRSREAQVPALCELLDLPYTGADPSVLALALDKGLTKRFLAQAGFQTPAFTTMVTGREKLPQGFAFPAVVKTVGEAHQRGAASIRVVENEPELRAAVKEMVRELRQAAVVEQYVPGRQFRVALLGERRPRVLPILEVELDPKADPYPVYYWERLGNGCRFVVPADIDAAMARELERLARGVFSAIGLRDWALVDFRLDSSGRVHFLKADPMPALATSSPFVRIAEAAGIDFQTLVTELLAPALRRLRQQRRERLLAGRL